MRGSSPFEGHRVSLPVLLGAPGPGHHELVVRLEVGRLELDLAVLGQLLVPRADELPGVRAGRLDVGQRSDAAPDAEAVLADAEAATVSVSS